MTEELPPPALSPEAPKDPLMFIIVWFGVPMAVVIVSELLHIPDMIFGLITR